MSCTRITTPLYSAQPLVMASQEDIILCLSDIKISDENSLVARNRKEKKSFQPNGGRPMYLNDENVPPLPTIVQGIDLKGGLGRKVGICFSERFSTLTLIYSATDRYRPWRLGTKVGSQKKHAL